MDKTLLHAAHQGLSIRDVALRASMVALDDKFDPAYQDVPRNIQLMQRTIRSETVEVEDDGSPHHLFRVFVRLGIRWVHDLDETATDPDQENPDNVDVLAVVEATFVAEYEMIKGLEQPALDEFAMHNAPWHIWPYWREYVANQCARLNIPKATMPMHCLQAQDPSAADDITS